MEHFWNIFGNLKISVTDFSCSSGTWHTVKRSAQLIDIIGVIIIAWGSRDINLPIIPVSREQITLNECLTDVHVVTMHIILCRKGENHAETAGMRDRAESVLKISPSLFILSMHMLTLDNETHLALFEFPLLTLNFIVKASGEDFVLGSQSRSVDAYPAFSSRQAFHLQFLRCDPCVFNRAAKHLTAMFGVLHAPCVPFWSIGGFMLLLGLRT